MVRQAHHERREPGAALSREPAEGSPATEREVSPGMGSRGNDKRARRPVCRLSRRKLRFGDEAFEAFCAAGVAQFA